MKNICRFAFLGIAIAFFASCTYEGDKIYTTVYKDAEEVEKLIKSFTE